jgi:hypothetical protein
MFPSALAATLFSEENPGTFMEDIAAESGAM